MEKVHLVFEHTEFHYLMISSLWCGIPGLRHSSLAICSLPFSITRILRSDTDPARRTTYVISACTMQAYRRVPAADKDWCSGKCYLLCSRIKLWKKDQLSSIITTGL